MRLSHLQENSGTSLALTGSGPWLRSRAPCVPGANVRLKFPVTLALEEQLHLVYSGALWRT